MLAATSRSASEPLRLVELPSRPLRPGELRVRVRAIGVNPVDWKMRAGGPLGTAQRLIGPRGPLVVGIDFAARHRCEQRLGIVVGKTLPCTQCVNRRVRRHALQPDAERRVAAKA